jgi:flavorubredoxin
MTAHAQADPLPRQLAPGLWWLGACLALPHHGVIYHAYQSVFVLAGDDASMIIEGGLPNDVDIIDAQLTRLLEHVPAVRYLWMTHQETPHAGGLARLMERFPEAELVGDVSDYHLYFPQFADRMRQVDTGASLDLGGTEFRIVEAVLKDLSTTQWGLDTRTRALFPGDGFAYSHLHNADQCGHLAEEVPELDIAELAGFFAEHSLNWTRFRDLDPILDQLQVALDELGVAIIGPTHGLPITDVPRIAPKVIEGLRAMRRNQLAA